MRIFFLFTLWLATALSICAAPDDIDTFVSGLDKSGMWMNGTYVPIKLPADAPTAQVVDQILRLQQGGNTYRTYNANPLQDYRIVEVKQVVIPNGAPPDNTYTGVVTRNSSGDKIGILIRYENVDWWYRCFHITNEPFLPGPAPDEIDKAITEGVPDGQEIWVGDMKPSTIGLPPEASPAQIVEQVEKQADSRRRDISDQFKIIIILH